MTPASRRLLAINTWRELTQLPLFSATARGTSVFGRDPWTATDVPDPQGLPFTVIELHLDGDGDGEGTTSVATDVRFDTTAATVTLASYDDAPVLLETVMRQPPPYWARSE